MERKLTRKNWSKEKKENEKKENKSEKKQKEEEEGRKKYRIILLLLSHYEKVSKTSFFLKKKKKGNRVWKSGKKIRDLVDQKNKQNKNGGWKRKKVGQNKQNWVLKTNKTNMAENERKRELRRLNLAAAKERQGSLFMIPFWFLDDSLFFSFSLIDLYFLFQNSIFFTFVFFIILLKFWNYYPPFCIFGCFIFEPFTFSLHKYFFLKKLECFFHLFHIYFFIFII